MLVLGTAAVLRTLPPVSLRFCGTVIADAGVVKNLGVYVDRHLNFEAHVDCITRKCTGILIALSHTRNVIPRGTLKCIVDALVMSIVRYCLSIYGSCGATQLRRVQKIVNFCVRVVTGQHRYDHVTRSFQLLQWLNAEQLVAYHTVCALGRILESRQPDCLHGTIGPRANQRHAYETRQADLFSLPNIRREAGRRRLCYRGVKLINRMGADPGGPGFRRNARLFAGSLGAR